MATATVDISELLARMGRRSVFDDDAASAGETPAPRQRQLAMSPLVERRLAAGAAVAVSISGGKDSMAVALAVARHLDAIGHRGPRLLIHSDLGRVEWRDSLPSCQRLAAYLGWELQVVRRMAGDMLARWEGRWASSVARYEALECVKLILPWSTPSLRFCTSELKTAIITRALKQRFPEGDIVNVVGIRRQESPKRQRMPVAAEFSALARKRGTGVTWNAIIEWSLEDVLDEILLSGVAMHEAYTRYGSTRVSCSFCIMSSMHDLLASASCADNRSAYQAMVELEARSTFAFQGSQWLADVAPQLLPAELVADVRHAKRRALQRQQAEAELPDHLLFSKGWPTCMPTVAEAQLIADVRRRVSEAVGLRATFVTPREVIARYADLMRSSGNSAITEPF